MPNTQAEALFFLVNEYDRTNNKQNSSLLDFWKQEYSKQSLQHRVKIGQLDQRLVKEILDDNFKTSDININMIRILARMNENHIKQFCP